MPDTAPGRRYNATATKAAVHGNPAVEKRHAGIAFKSAQAGPAYPNPTNALAAQQIAIGEGFVIDMDGVHVFPSSLLPAGVAEGDFLWIDPADNTLRSAAGSGLLKFGLISYLDTTLARVSVNLSRRDMI